METKPVLKKSASSRGATGNATAFSKAPVTSAQIVRRLGNQDPKRVASAISRDEPDITSELPYSGSIVTGTNVPHSSQKIGATVIPTTTDLSPRKNVSVKLTSTKESPLDKDDRVLKALKIRQ
jgi:hypothetical protein